MDAAEGVPRRPRKCNVSHTRVKYLLEELHERGYITIRRSPSILLLHNNSGTPLVVGLPLDWPMIVIGNYVRDKGSYRGVAPPRFSQLLPEEGTVSILSADLLCVEGEGEAYRGPSGTYIIKVSRGIARHGMLADFSMPYENPPPVSSILEVVLEAGPSHILLYRFFTVGPRNYVTRMGAGGLPTILVYPRIRGVQELSAPRGSVALPVRFNIRGHSLLTPVEEDVRNVYSIIKSLKEAS